MIMTVATVTVTVITRFPSVYKECQKWKLCGELRMRLLHSHAICERGQLDIMFIEINLRDETRRDEPGTQHDVLYDM